MPETFLKKFFDSGTLFIWLCGAGLATSLLMIGGLLLLIMINGMGYFWPMSLVEMNLRDGTSLIGEIVQRKIIPNSVTSKWPEGKSRVKLKVGNRDLYGLDFKWIDEDDIVSQTYPANVLSVERREWGKFFGRLHSINKSGKVVASNDLQAWEALALLIDRANAVHGKIHDVEKDLIGSVNYEIEEIRLDLRSLKLQGLQNSLQAQDLQQRVGILESTYEEYVEKLEVLYEDLREHSVVFMDANGHQKILPIGQIIRVLRPNAMELLPKVWIYMSNVWTVLTEEPREANTEGGLAPAIFGTVLMVLIMSIAVVPFGVLAAFYLKEYARQGVMVRLVRIAVNNLAGVPSIVFGIFGLGFFVYAVGGTIDSVFFAETLPNPTYGTGGILWASLTLALMTVPVVIVATEEGLSAVPREYREGSFGVGATKFETLWKVVLPCAMPGILTGLILAISRATGEVAPLMLTGVVKLAPSLPLDAFPPFLHLDRKFMHLGFHIYDVGFQSPNIEAAKPMVYVTTLILVFVVVMLNIFAIRIRNKMKKQYTGSAI